MTNPTTSPEDLALSIALTHAHGKYQRAIVTGHARLSGSDLRGTAKKWSSRYKHSRESLLHRLLCDHRLVISVDRSRPGPNTLVIRPSTLVELAALL